jgi:hypothetical protein
MAALAPIAPAGFTLAEAPDSPKYSFGDKPKMVRTWNGTYAAIMALRNTLPNGTVDGTWRVTESTADTQPGNLARLVVSYQASSAGSLAALPLDKVSLQDFDINPRIENHPRYSGLSRTLLTLVRQAHDAPESEKRDEAFAALTAATTTGTTEAKAAAVKAKELLDAIDHGQETYYLAGLTYTWSSSYWTPPALFGGGITETPTGPSWGFAAYLLTFGLSWLRKADKMDDSDGNQYRIARTWVGALSGHWNANLYAPPA